MLKTRKVFFKGKKTTEEILRIKLEPMGGGSLIKLSEQESKIATEAFSIILEYISLLSQQRNINQNWFQTTLLIGS